jgi:hypothetical protein
VGATRQAIQRLVLGLHASVKELCCEDLWQQMRTSLPPDCAAIFPTPVGWAARRLVAEWTAELRRAWATRGDASFVHGVVRHVCEPDRPLRL